MASRARALLGGILVALGGGILVAVAATSVGAHGELVASSPLPGQKVGSVTHIDLVFSTAMRDWSIEVERPDERPLAGQAVQKADPYLSFETAPLSDEGQYIVRYRGTDSDGDLLDGAFAFSVEAGAGPPTPVSAQVDLGGLDDDGVDWVFYGLLVAGVLVVAVLGGMLAEKIRRLRAT